jgi:hypothetical protein
VFRKFGRDRLSTANNLLMSQMFKKHDEITGEFLSCLKDVWQAALPDKPAEERFEAWAAYDRLRGKHMEIFERENMMRFPCLIRHPKLEP